jgi:signal transduction histidine kinase
MGVAMAGATATDQADEAKTRSWGLPDVGPALILAAFSVLLLTLPYRQGIPNLPPFEVASLAALATTLPLLLVRRLPELCLTLAMAGYLWYLSLEPQQISGPSLAVYVALFGVGAFGRSRRKRAVQVVVILALEAYIAVHVLGAASALGVDVWLVLFATVSYNVLICVAAVLMGDWYRQRKLYEEELDRRARQLERDRVERERRVVIDERVRIARELHDVVAHHVSLMGIQAGAARTVLHDAPERSIELLTSIEDASRRAVDEMRRLLGALREDATEGGVDRRPNLAQLDGLLDSARKTGLDATLEIRGSARPDLPDTLDLSAYRIVQEALTNVIRHANARRVHVVLSYLPAALEISVEDDGRGGAMAGRAGRGLVGMRERAALFGGTLSAGPGADGGFRIDAHLPVAS